MYCKKCGQQLPEGSNFCPNCGADNAPADNTQQNNQNTQQGSVFNGTVSGGAAPCGLTHRSIGICILLSIVTCGIYAYVWLYQMAEDLRAATGDVNAPSGGMVVLLSIVTCGIYLYYWLYKAGEQVNTVKASRGMMTDSSSPIIYLVLGIFGLALVSYCLIQNELNQVAK